MIKTGIIGGTVPAAAQLLQLLLHHPDVDLRCVQARDCNGRRLCDVHHNLVGETELAFCDAPDWEQMDVIFLCDEQARVEPFMDQMPERVKVIDLSTHYRLDDEQETGFVYGLSEVNRRRMVHDCYQVTCPGDLAMALSLALIPLAKNLLLNSELHVMAVVGDNDASAGSRVVKLPVTSYQGQIDEVRRVMNMLQTSFGSPIHLTAMKACFARGLLVTVYFKSNIDVTMVRELFDKYYDDHNFTFLVNHEPDLAEVVGTNKCLIGIEREGDYLRLTAAIDNIIKGSVGNAVHVMNLLFGLHERTGLQL